MGSIPACAGEPPIELLKSGPLRVYPRVCGGTYYVRYVRCCRDGLSPRVRGNQHFRAGDDTGIGSIPACAGEPVTICVLSVSERVYPRVCGGTYRSTPASRPQRGLSPRVRGNHHPALSPGALPRSIPACAGEPSNSRTHASQFRVYPRVCGGTQRLHLIMTHIMGLSPRVRGNQ